MFRLSRYLRLLAEPEPVPPAGPVEGAPRPVVIWNLVRRCNLECRHCYAASTDREFSGELNTEEALAVVDDLHRFGVPALVLSGGEPLLRPDLFSIATHARTLGLFTALSSNGTLIDNAMAAAIAATGYNYVGISLDGLGPVHDRIRGKMGAFASALGGIRRCRDAGIRVGIRFTLTRDNAHQLPDMLALCADEGVEKFYLSHLNYAGRGGKHREDDPVFHVTRNAMETLFEAGWDDIQAGRRMELVTGNNDADAAYLWLWARRHFPERADILRRHLLRWGGNASGSGVANIDNRGHVHPDTFWSHHRLGNVRERPFSAIWTDPQQPLLAALRQRPRPITGRCAACRHLPMCGGNTRVRAERLSGDLWAEDPGCYLNDAEIMPSSGALAAQAVDVVDDNGQALHRNEALIGQTVEDA